MTTSRRPPSLQWVSNLKRVGCNLIVQVIHRTWITTRFNSTSLYSKLTLLMPPRASPRYFSSKIFQKLIEKKRILMTMRKDQESRKLIKIQECNMIEISRKGDFEATFFLLRPKVSHRNWPNPSWKKWRRKPSESSTSCKFMIQLEPHT